jgi:peroxiredoxin
MARIKVGQRAPDFTLVDGERVRHTLSQYIPEKNVVLAFYILAFTGG